MDINQIETLIGSLGFPIACVIAMFHMWNEERKEHKAEAEKWTEAVNNNTQVMQSLVNRLETIERMITHDK